MRWPLFDTSRHEIPYEKLTNVYFYALDINKCYIHLNAHLETRHTTKLDKITSTTDMFHPHLR